MKPKFCPFQTKGERSLAYLEFARSVLADPPLIPNEWIPVNCSGDDLRVLPLDEILARRVVLPPKSEWRPDLKWILGDVAVRELKS